MPNTETKRDFKGSNRRIVRRTASGIIAAVLMAGGIAAMGPSHAYAEKADVSISHWYGYPQLQVPELKPVWEAKVDNYLKNEAYYGQQAIAEDGKVFVFSGKKLIALDAKTGKRLWAYGKGLTPIVAYGNGVVYGLTADHKPYAVDAKTGKAKWVSGSSTWIEARLRTEKLVPTADTLYMINGSTTFAFDNQTGKLRWKADEALAEGNGTEYLEIADGVVLRTFMVQGALTSVQLNAYDQKTGKKLWDEFGQGEALHIKNGLVYTADYYSSRLTDYESSPDRAMKISAYNLKTGALKGTREYRWKMEGEPPYTYGYGAVLASGDKLYMEQGNKVAEYPLDAFKEGEKPLRTFQRPYGEGWELLTVAQDRLIYKSGDGELAGIKLANGQAVQWNGDAPISNVNVYGKGMYRAERNGTLLAINMLTNQPVFRVKTGADLHESTLKTNGMIIIQAEGRLLGVKLPASLK
ncbi:PQQ-binding-like beta-propeller repeat protein [Paenibacillus sp. JJ-223]|uniref:outer membrane protein assembly factor BamB family protein n=1 Tax=Paenibacillus sp. JJ-223 TaxID=2905647 RepID=UPI001F2B9D63|nr:PQQ-binding-like beta-propeller repeat protein [Paenibacillus sp. JJ-223]CAH1198674.1 Outer membrane protein assembly factor BamB [Paenibacillus sp. JJ-223]